MERGAGIGRDHVGGRDPVDRPLHAFGVRLMGGIPRFPGVRLRRPRAPLFDPFGVGVPECLCPSR